jgi:hypothetical protein
MAYLLAGPFVALVGIVAVFFVMRRKSVEKRSMYSARRSQIEHKVRAARQRTLAPHGRGQKPQEQTIPAETSTFAPQAPRATVSWETPAYGAPPVAPPSMPPPPPSREAPAGAPWDVPAAASAPAPTFDYPPAPPQPAYTPPAAEPFRPAPEPTPMAPSEPVWAPAPAPAVEPAAQMEPAAATAASSTSAGGWSIVSTAKGTAEPEPDGKKKKKGKGGEATATGAWQLASGDAPGAEADEPELRRSSGTVMAVAQYAVLVVGLVMVLIGVLVMVANSHVT